MRVGNLKRGIPAVLPEELFSTLALGQGVRIERIVSRGHTTEPEFWWDQDEAELVVLLEGHARLEIEGDGELDLSPFDWLEIPPRVRHRVTFTPPGVDTIWLAIFFRTDAQPVSTAIASLPSVRPDGEDSEG